MYAVALLVVLSAMVSSVYGACDNACSGHGTCTLDDVCKCYDNWGIGLAHDSGDCSERVCPYELAWVDTPNYLGRVHKYAECAGRGICNRETGECACFDGYEGKGCQRMSCPDSCSGHGTCEYIQDMAYMKTYSEWANNYDATTGSDYLSTFARVAPVSSGTIMIIIRIIIVTIIILLLAGASVRSDAPYGWVGTITTAAADTAVTVVATTSGTLVNGMQIVGTNIATGTTVSAVTITSAAAGTATLSAATTAALTNGPAYGVLPTNEIYPSLVNYGFKSDAKTFDYRNWDVKKARGCVCDATYGDIDCSKKMCPYGTDVLDFRLNSVYDANYQIQKIKFNSLSTIDKLATRTFALQFVSKLNETFSTIPIVFPDVTGATAEADDLAKDIELALLQLPNRVIDGVSVSYLNQAGSKAAAVNTHVSFNVLITFTGASVQGPQHPLVVLADECQRGCTPKIDGLNLETRVTVSATSATTQGSYATALYRGSAVYEGNRIIIVIIFISIIIIV